MHVRVAVPLLALLSACAIAEPIPGLPATHGLEGVSVAVAGPLSAGLGGPDMPVAQEAFHQHMAEDLELAGAIQGSRADLVIRLDSLNRSDASATVLKADGSIIDRFTVENLGCLSIAWGLAFDANGKCFARTLLVRILESQRVQAAVSTLPKSHRAAPPANAMSMALPDAGPSARPTQAQQPQQVQQQQAPQQQAPPPAARRTPLPLKGKLAVLELRSLTKDVNKDQARYFTDLVRQASLKLQPQLDVMTRENLLVLLSASGKKLEECEGECEVDTGRRIGADLIVSGEIQKVGTRFKLSLKLHDTKEGRLLSTSIGSGKSIDELDDGASRASEELLTKE
ncbi:MAG: hypothetical protein JST92_19785 [Deltaproteobacteria bacterium]|nr:hypothetical protein [Deltaproteobacteria bacterium]